MVRNSADTVALNLLHHLHGGIDVMYVVDNGSTDGTTEILQRFAERFPVHWRSDEGGFRQDEVMTALARQAAADGAAWIVPIDADEFWWCRGDLREELENTSAVALECKVVHFIQQRTVTGMRPVNLLTMTRRVAQSRATWREARGSVEARETSFVEAEFPDKLIFRASPGLFVHRGSHGVDGLEGNRVRSTSIECLHAPLRARGALDLRVEHGQRLEAMAVGGDLGWQSRRWSAMATESKLDSEWVANSYSGDSINVYGSLRPVVADERLAEVVRPWVDHELVQGRTVRRSDHPRRPDEDSPLAEAVRDLSVQVRLLSTELTFAQQKSSEDRNTLLAEVRRLDTQLAGLRGALQDTVHVLQQQAEVSNQLRVELDAAGAWARSESEAVAQRDKVIYDLERRLDGIRKSPAGRIYRVLSAAGLRAWLRRLNGLR
ncbi:MAG: glycosyltransferase family 2 protein [Acidobacteriota bacterium]